MHEATFQSFFRKQLRCLAEFFSSAFLVCFLFHVSCTNLEIGGTDRRFNENMKGDLRSYADFSPASPSSFTFAVIGDTHIGSSGGYQLAKAIPLMKADGDQFVVIAGDMTDTGEDGQYRTLLNLLTTNSMSYYPCIGNHDIFFNGWSNYRSHIGRSIYSFNAGIVHFVVVDTANGQIGERQLDWLERDLAAATQTHKVVIMHYPPYVGNIGSIFQLSSEEESAVLKDMMYKYNVKLLIAGHYHGFNEATIGRTRFIVSGGGNNILDPGNNSHYLRITVTPTDLIVDKKSL